MNNLTADQKTMNFSENKQSQAAGAEQINLVSEEDAPETNGAKGCIYSDKFANGDSDLVNQPEDVKQKRGIVSIDVTKALMLLGFATWSALEPGNNTIKCVSNIS